MKKLNFTSVIFIGLIIVCCLLTLTALLSTAEISEKENRTLQTLPEFQAEKYWDGSFFKDLEAYFYDHFPQRDGILDLVAVYDKIKGVRPEVMALEKGNNMNLVNPSAGEDTAGRFEEKSSGAEKQEEKAGEDFSAYKTQTQNLEIMAVRDTLLELYHFQEKKIAAYTTALNQFAARMPEGIAMYSLLAPTRIGLTDREYSDFSDPQDKAIEYLYSQLDKRYRTVNVFGSLYEHRQEYLYFRSDHHWTQLGAYYAAQEFTRTAGVEFKEIADYEKHSFEGFLGYLYNNNQVEKVAENPDVLDAYVYSGGNPEITNYYYAEDGTLSTYTQPVINLPAEGIAANYGIFLGGDFPTIVYRNSEPGNGRNLMIVKDSYANAFIPWLTQSFDKIVVIDPRFYQENMYELAVQEEITDFLVIDYLLATGLDGFIVRLDEIGDPKESSSPKDK